MVITCVKLWNDLDVDPSGVLTALAGGKLIKFYSNLGIHARQTI